MKIIRLGGRTADPAWWNMAAVGSPVPHPFRMGDRAAAHLVLLDWRARNPDRRLVIYDDPWQPGAEASRALDPAWLFAGIADEIVQAGHHREPLPPPVGENLYCRDLWYLWPRLRDRAAEPTIRPPPDALDRARRRLAEGGVGRRFVTLQPLFDAGYSVHRNAPWGWWLKLARELTAVGPLVVLGDHRHRDVLARFPGALHLCSPGDGPMEALAAVSLAGLHVGGETGLTLWAGLFSTPLLAVYRFPIRTGLTDTRPLAFKAPVGFGPVSGEPRPIARLAHRIFQDGRRTA